MTKKIVEPAELNLLVTEERLEDIDMVTYYNLNKTPEAPIDFIIHFCADENGNYMEVEEARNAVLTGRKIKDVKALADMLMASIEEAAVPKG